MARWLKNNLDLILITVLVALPAVLWLSMRPLSDRFVSSSATFRSLGQITGLLGMALLSLNFILTTRFKFLDRLFNGLNRVYLKHHMTGAIAFCLLLFHPTFLVIQYLSISLKSSFDFIFSIRDWPINFGKVGLAVFIVLMAITFYFNFKYQNWKNTHKFLGIVLLLGGLHMLLVPSDISGNAVLKYYMLGLAALGAYSYFYRTILESYRKQEYEYKLSEVKKINDSVVEIKLTPLSRKIGFLPGQFIFLRFILPDRAKDQSILSESHPFSITSPMQDGLSLGIKTLGDYTSMVYLLKPGAICKVEGPFGAFSYLKAESKKQIWIAGGIGITPFLGMARQIDADGIGDYEIDLYYSVKNADELAFGEELERISARNNGFKLHNHFSQKEGYLSARSVLANDENILEADIFLCGPPAFMKSLREQFIKLGINNGKIHSEEFSLQD